MGFMMTVVFLEMVMIIAPAVIMTVEMAHVLDNRRLKRELAQSFSAYSAQVVAQTPQPPAAVEDQVGEDEYDRLLALLGHDADLAERRIEFERNRSYGGDRQRWARAARERFERQQ